MTVAQGDFQTYLHASYHHQYISTAVLVLRIWYLFRHSNAARVLVMSCFAVCVIAEAVTLGLSFADLHSEMIVVPGIRILELGCTAPPPSKLWRLFIPALILHTILYIFTAYRGLINRSIAAEAAPLMRRLIREYVAMPCSRLLMID
jgi:hypothetical protein